MFRLLSLVCFLCSVAHSAKILAVWPVPSISHQVVFRPLTQGLARQGHQVTVLTTDPAFEKGKAPKNLREVDLHNISYTIWRSQFYSTSTGSKNDLAEQFKIAVNLFLKIIVEQIKTEEVKQIIQNEKFDLVLVEACARVALVFSHIYKVPVIQVSSYTGFMDNMEKIGAPIHPLVYPLSSRQRVFNLTTFEKMSELYSYYVMDSVYQQQLETEHRELRKLFPDMPSLDELAKNVEMLFLNVYPYWDGNRPVPPSVVYIGGIHQKPQNKLPQDIETYLNSSKNGVIYVSFGTNVLPSMLPPEKIETMVKVFSQLPYDVMWKWDKDDLVGKTENIKLFKWVPQSDLLRHPKVKLFITQCGFQSTDEAITAGVPLLGIPMLGDQWYNAEKYAYHKIGVKVTMDTLNEEELRKGIYEILDHNDEYRQNVRDLRSLMHDQPQSPLERAIWWLEHVLRHQSGRHLRSPSANMPWSEYLVLDVVALLMVGVLSIILVGVVSLVIIVKMLTRTSKVKQS